MTAKPNALLRRWSGEGIRPRGGRRYPHKVERRNASRYPVRQVNILAVPFATTPDGKKLGDTSAQFPCRYIPPNSTHEEALIRDRVPESMRFVPHVESAVRLDFMDYQGTHWVRAANGSVTPSKN